MPTEPNLYSKHWFDFFHVGIDEARTIRETEFVSSCAPLPEFQNILDACCGMGRHARALASRGYSVTGIDRDAGAIASAREIGADVRFIVADIRNYELEPGKFDAAIVMGQSFGHFDAKTNRDMLARLAASLRENGRVVLDLWNREFFTARQGERELETSRGIVRESRRVKSGRLFVQLDYPDGTQEKFEWQLFTPPQMKTLAESVELDLLVSCSNFDEKMVPSPGNPRIQFVLAHCA